MKISILNGLVIGFGAGMSGNSQIRIATEKTVFFMPEAGIGLLADSYLLSRVLPNISLGLFLGLTGHRVKGKDLVKWGIATHFVPMGKISSLYKALTDGVTQETLDSFILAIVNSFSEPIPKEPIEELDEIVKTF